MTRLVGNYKSFLLLSINAELRLAEPVSTNAEARRWRLLLALIKTFSVRGANGAAGACDGLRQWRSAFSIALKAPALLTIAIRE